MSKPPKNSSSNASVKSEQHHKASPRKHPVVTRGRYCSFSVNSECLRDSDKLEAQIRDAQQEVPLIECGTRITEPPSEAEKQKKRREIGLSTDNTNIAVVGPDITEFVKTISLYPPKGSKKIEWRAIPEPGSRGVLFLDYFHNQGLYAYNFIIILMTDRLTDIDCSIASMSHRCGIPFIFIRLKSNYLLDWDEVPINERAEKMAKMRSEIFDHLRKTLVEEMKIPDQDFPFFLINMRALKLRLQSKPSKPDIVECDEAALLDYLGRQDYLYIPSLPKISASEGPKGNNKKSLDNQHCSVTEDTKHFIKVAFLGYTALGMKLSKTSVGSKWSGLSNVHWSVLKSMESNQTFAKYLDSLSLTSYKVILILVGPWISYPDICTAEYCERRQISYAFLRLNEDKCALFPNHPLQHPLSFDRADEWRKSFIPNETTITTLKASAPVFWIEELDLIVELLSGKSESGQAAELLAYIEDKVKNTRSGPSATSPNAEVERSHMLHNSIGHNLA